MPHRARRLRRDPASVGRPFTRSVGGHLAQHRTPDRPDRTEYSGRDPLLQVTTTVRDNARRAADLHSAPCPSVIASAVTERDDLCAVASLLAPAWNRMNDLVNARHPGCSLGRARASHSFGPFKVWRLGLVVRSSLLAVSRGRPGLILLSVRAGHLRTYRRVLLLAAGRWGPLAYPAGWSRWVSAVWRRPAPGVRTAWARARRDPARMMSLLARVMPV